MNIDLDEKEVRVLVQAMWLYNNRLLEIEKDLASLKREEVVIQGDDVSRNIPKNLDGIPILRCCVDSGEKKPEPPPFYRDYSYCKILRDKLKSQQMVFPAEQHKDKGYDYVSDAVLNEKFGYNDKREKSKWIRCVSGQKYIG